MAIKSKSSKMYSNASKITAVIVVLLASLLACTGLVYVSDTRYESGLNYSSYYDTETFYAQYSQLVRDVVNVNLVYKNEENIKSGAALNEEKVIYNFALSNSLGEYTIYSSVGQPVNVKFMDYNDQAYFDERYETYKQQAIQDQLYEYDDSVKELERYSDFCYNLVSSKDNISIGNLSVNEIDNLEINSFLDGRYSKGKMVYVTENYYTYSDEGELINYFYYDNYLDSVSRILLNNGYSLHVGVKTDDDGSGVFNKQCQAYDKRREFAPKAVGVAVACAVIMVVGIVFLAYVAGQTGKNSQVTLMAIDNIFNDVHLIIFIAIAGLSLFLAVQLMTSTYYMREQWVNLVKGLMCLLFVVDTIVLTSFVTCMSRQIKKKQLFSNTFIAATVRFIASFIKYSNIRMWTILCLILFAVANAILGGFAYASESLVPIAFMVILNVIAVIFVSRAMRSIKKIMFAVKETSEGNFDCKIDMKNISPSMVNFANDVSNMQSGLKQAVGRAVKGEKMKTELITNVSHDLKTPLTSIITYVDLLKREELDNERAQNYVAILDEKSRRLKQLIEDLVEASKASSGNLAVSKAKLDYKELMEQALGEFEERIEDSGVEFKFNAEDGVYIYADGSHMWRIAENLITNAIKYTMKNTRVFIDISKNEKEGILVIKNVSSIPIDEVDVKSLTERFVRGDTSRTMEGSGLGLSITKSLTEIQGGKLDVSVDGDVFKVTVKMPLYTE